MSAPKYTPEPWKFDLELITGSDGFPIADMSPGDAMTADESDANAARIVACVNYCAGTPTEQLNCTSDKAVRTGSDALDRERLLLTRQRDELAAELRRIAEANPSKWEAEVRDQFQAWAQNRARAALAKLDGGS